MRCNGFFSEIVLIEASRTNIYSGLHLEEGAKLLSLSLLSQAINQIAKYWTL